MTQSCSNRKCKSDGRFSINGRCHGCGAYATSPYNGNTEEPKAPTTERGKRRLEKKRNKE